MYQDDEDSSVASSYEEDQMEAFIDRCSICFDSEHDLCVESCRDQFCIECFRKYIAQVVESSWGLSVTVIKCPVCNDVISKQEWCQYVPGAVVDLYDRYNEPFRSYTRTCGHCELEMTPCVYQHAHNNLYQQSGFFSDFLKTMLSSCPKEEQHIADKDHIAIYGWIKIFNRGMNEMNLLKTYKQLMKDIFQFEKCHITRYSTGQQYPHPYSYQLSISFLKASTCPDEWKSLQFNHITLFPNMNCSNCQVSMCLHCGYDSHVSLSCEENMKHLIHNAELTNEAKNTIIWTLENSRQCPSCSIMINRDEGCNKVDCSYCGHCFCWCCRSSWSDGCGFYRCSTTTNYNLTTVEYSIAQVIHMAHYFSDNIFLD
ncbi:unnamed protein product [Rhizopus stolonifer]